MLHILNTLSPKALIFLLVLPLAACDIGKAYIDNNSSSGVMSTNAVFVGYREGNDLQVNTITSRNTSYSYATKTFLVENEDKRYTFMFACPSTFEGAPHKVFFYYTTVAEVNNIEHLCKKNEEEFLSSWVYGQIGDVDINQKEKVLMSLDSGGSYQQTREAFAANIVRGKRDFMAMKVATDVSDNEVPNAFAIARGVSVGEQPQRQDLIFTDGASGPLTTTTRIPPGSVGNVYVSDIPQSNPWTVEVGYRTKNKTYLRLAQSASTQFQFVAVPKYVNYLDKNNQPVTQNQRFRLEEGEGHEFTGKVMDSKGRILNQTKQFIADPFDVDVKLPVIAASGALLGKVENEGGPTITLSWPSFTSLVHGRSSLYHWVIKGVPNDAERKSALDPVIDQLEWHVYVTPGWISAGSPDSLQLNIPPISVPPVISLVQGNEELVETWKREWNFKSGTTLSGQLDNFSSEGPPQDLLYYLTHGDYVENMKFSQNIQYDL